MLASTCVGRDHLVQLAAGSQHGAGGMYIRIMILSDQLGEKVLDSVVTSRHQA